MNLKLSLGVDFDPRCVHNAQVSYVELAILVENHELTLPELFVVADDVVVAIAFTDFELSQVTVELNLQVLQLLSIDICELQHKVVALLSDWFNFNHLSLHVNFSFSLLLRQLQKVHLIQQLL